MSPNRLPGWYAQRQGRPPPVPISPSIAVSGSKTARLAATNALKMFSAAQGCFSRRLARMTTVWLTGRMPVEKPLDERDSNAAESAA